MPRFSRTVAHRESGFPEAGLRASALPSQSRLMPCQLPRRGSRVSSPPEACRRPSLASPFGGGGLALARTERAARQRLAQSQVLPPPLGGAGAQWAPFSAWSPLPRRSVMDAAHWTASPEPAGESGLAGGGEGSPPEACRRPSLASPFGGGGLALARTERAARQRPLPKTIPVCLDLPPGRAV